MHARTRQQRPGNRLPGRITAIRAGHPIAVIEVAIADSVVCVPCSSQRIARRGWRVGQAVALLVPGDAAVLLIHHEGRHGDRD